MSLLSLPVRQIAYAVDDARKAAERHHALFGSGPFFVLDNIPLKVSLHRGEPAPFDHTSAYGQWGEVMIEFMQQNNEGPSAVRDMYAPGQEGFHHVALIVDSLPEARAHFAAEGLEEALYAEMEDGFAFVMVDGRERYGHMIELYEGAESLLGFYDYVKKSAGDFSKGVWRKIG